MAVKAKAEITLATIRDVQSVTRYYLLQSSTSSIPAKPTANPPGGNWIMTEPSYTSGSTNSLYFTDLTVFSDGTFNYSDVSLSSSYEAAKAAYNQALAASSAAAAAQASADAIPATVPGINLSPFFSHDLTDVYDADSNPEGYWAQNGANGWNKNSKFTFTQLEDGWLHVHIDNSSGTSTVRNDCCCPRYDPVIKPGTKYTFLVEFRNNQTTGAGAGTDFYLVQQGGYVQFWGQNTADAPAAKLDGIGGASTLVSNIPSDGSYAFSRFTKFSEPEGSSRLEGQNIMATFVFRANAGLVVDYDIRLSMYLGEYWGPYVPYVISDVSAIRQAAEDLQASVDALQPELIIGTHGTAATAAWTGTSTVLTEIMTGSRIQFKLSSAGASNVTLNLTLKDGTTTGAKAVYYSNTTRLGTQYGAGAVVDLIYDGEAWRVLNPYTNSNTVGAYAGAVKAGTNGVKNYSLVMRDTADTWVSLTTSAGTGTSKARYTGGLYPDKVLYMGSNSAYAAGATTGNCYEALALNLNYSTNSGSTLTAGKAVYLVGELHSDGLFYLDPVWWTQTLPTTENGKTYIYLGLAYSTSNIYLTPENTLYQFYDGKFRKLSEIEEMKAAKTATNYIYDSQALGLIVAREAPASDSDVSTIGWHTRQTADGFDVYNGNTRVAHYGTEVWIGAGGRKIKISDNGYRIDRGNTNLMYAGLSESNVLITKSESWWTGRNDTMYDSIYTSGEEITLASTIASWAVQAIRNVYLAGKPDTAPVCLVRGENYTVASNMSITLMAADTENADDIMELYLQDVPDRLGDNDEYHFTASVVVEYTTAALADYFQFGENSANNGLDALAQGIGCEAGGSYSAAQGDHVMASNVGETAVGRYNETGPDVMFNVGCGTSSERKSALMVYGDGKTRARQILAEDIVSELGAIDTLQARNIYGTDGTLLVPTKLEVLKSDTSTVTRAGSVTIQDINSIVRKSGWARLQYSFKANAAIAAWTTIGTIDLMSRPAAAVRCYSNGRFWQITTAGNIQPTSALTSGETYIVETVYPIRDYYS